MNRQLMAQGFRKIAEAFSLFEEAFSGQSEEVTSTVTAATTDAAPAAQAEKKTPAEKKSRKSPAPKAAPKVEEPEETEDEEQDETTDAEGEETEGEESDDLADLEDDSEEVATVTRDALRKNIVAYAKKHGKPKAYGLLEKFGAKNVDGLKEKDLDKVNAQIQKGLK